MVNERKELYIIRYYSIIGMDEFSETTFKNPDEIIDFIKRGFEIDISTMISFISKIGYRIVKDDRIVKDIYTKIGHDCPVRKFVTELNGIITAYENDK